MVRAAIAVLFHRAAKLGHGQNHDVVHALAKVGVQRSDRLTELPQQVAELTLLVAFVDVRVPTANVSERDFEADPGFDQLRDLQKRIAKWSARIIRSILGLVLAGIYSLQIIDRLEGFSAGAMQSVLDDLVVIHRFEASLHSRRALPGANVEI